MERESDTFLCVLVARRTRSPEINYHSKSPKAFYSPPFDREVASEQFYRISLSLSAGRKGLATRQGLDDIISERDTNLWRWWKHGSNTIVWRLEVADRRGGGVAGFHRGEVEVIIGWFGERLFFFWGKTRYSIPSSLENMCWDMGTNFPLPKAWIAQVKQIGEPKGQNVSITILVIYVAKWLGFPDFVELICRKGRSLKWRRNLLNKENESGGEGGFLRKKTRGEEDILFATLTLVRIAFPFTLSYLFPIRRCVIFEEGIREISFFSTYWKIKWDARQAVSIAGQMHKEKWYDT